MHLPLESWIYKAWFIVMGPFERLWIWRRASQGGGDEGSDPFSTLIFSLFKTSSLELSWPHKRRYWCGGRAKLCVFAQQNWPRKRVFHGTQFKMQMPARLVQQVFRWRCETFFITSHWLHFSPLSILVYSRCRKNHKLSRVYFSARQEYTLWFFFWLSHRGMWLKLWDKGISNTKTTKLP